MRPCLSSPSPERNARAREDGHICRLMWFNLDLAKSMLPLGQTAKFWLNPQEALAMVHDGRRPSPAAAGAAIGAAVLVSVAGLIALVVVVLTRPRCSPKEPKILLSP